MKLGYIYGKKVRGGISLGRDPYTNYAAEFQKQIILESDDDLELLEQNINEESATPTYPLGTRLQVGERVFRYAKILPGTVLAPHAFLRGRSLVTSDAGIERGAFLGALVAGVKTVTWTQVGVIAVDQFAEGYLLCQGGFLHKIKSNTEPDAGVVTLTLYEAFTAGEAIAAGRYGLLLECPYANVALLTENGMGRPMGVIGWDPTDDNYVWIQTWGPASMIATPATIGGHPNEMELTLSSLAPVQEEVSYRTDVGDTIGTPMGYPTMGQSWVGADGINWDNENFIHIWLTIDP
ncbi:hypothetical protein ES703_57848 [subsurface metagenome]